MLDISPAGFPFGLTSAGALGSGFNRAKPLSPLSTGVPPRPFVSVTLMVMLAVEELESTKTGREIPVCAAMTTSKVVSAGVSAGSGLGIGWFATAIKDARPPGG